MCNNERYRFPRRNLGVRRVVSEIWGGKVFRHPLISPKLLTQTRWNFTGRWGIIFCTFPLSLSVVSMIPSELWGFVTFDPPRFSRNRQVRFFLFYVSLYYSTSTIGIKKEKWGSSGSFSSFRGSKVFAPPSITREALVQYHSDLRIGCTFVCSVYRHLFLVIACRKRQILGTEFSTYPIK